MSKQKIIAPDFIQIPRPVLTCNELQPSDKFLFGYIYWFTKLKLEKCTASNETLGELSGLTPNSVGNALLRLEKAGFIERVFADKAKRRRDVHCLVGYVHQTMGVRPSFDERTLSVVTDGGIRIDNKNNKNISSNSVQDEPQATSSVPHAKPDELDDLFEDLKKHLGTFNAKFPAERRAKLKQRLRNFSEKELLNAATNIKNSPHMQGKNDNNKFYGTMEYLLRNDGNVEKWSHEPIVQKRSAF